MIDENLEFAITQYLDGELPKGERAALEARLASDPEAARLLEEYRKLDAILATSMPLPDVKWDRLTEHLSAAIDEREQAASYRMSFWVRSGAKLAIAAMVLLVASVALRIYHNEQKPGVTPPTPVVAQSSVQVCTAEGASGPAVASVEVGPPTLADASRTADWYAAESVVTLPTHVEVFASAPSPAQDSFLPIR